MHICGMIGIMVLVRATFVDQIRPGLKELLQSDAIQIVPLLTIWSPLVMAFATGLRKKLSLFLRIGFVAFDVHPSDDAALDDVAVGSLTGKLLQQAQSIEFYLPTPVASSLTRGSK